MSPIARLRAYAASVLGLAAREAAPDASDETLAAIALLVHVARGDGVLAPAEAERLARLVEGRYAASRAGAEALIARAAALDAQTRDLAMLVESIGHEADREARTRLLGMAWSVAGADGKLDEFEEALVWRLAGLLRLDDEAVARARSEAGPAARDASGA